MKESARPDEAQIGTSSRCRVCLPSPGKGQKHLQRLANAARRDLEAAVREKAGGAISIAAAVKIAAIVTALTQAHRIGTVMAQAGTPGKDMSHETWQGYSDRLLRCREAADRGIVALGLSVQAAAPDDEAWRRDQQAALSSALDALGPHASSQSDPEATDAPAGQLAQGTATPAHFDEFAPPLQKETPTDGPH